MAIEKLTIFKNEKEKIEEVTLHDAEISKIIVDYNNGLIEMPIIMYERRSYKALLKFEGIAHMKIDRKEPWGSGKYIFGVNLYDDEGDSFRVNIVLNSGDQIDIVTSKMIYERKED